MTRAAVVLARPGNALDQQVTTGEEGDEQRLPKVFLTDHFGRESRGHRRHHAFGFCQFSLIKPRS